MGSRQCSLVVLTPQAFPGCMDREHNAFKDYVTGMLV